MLRAQLSGAHNCDRGTAALAVVVYSFALAAFFPHSFDYSPLDVRVAQVSTAKDSHPAALDDAYAFLDEAEAQWRERLPKNPGDVLQWCFAQDVATLLNLLAFAAARSVNALVPKQDQRATGRLTACDALADHIGLDPHAYVTADRLDYFGRVSKAHLIDLLEINVGKSRRENCEGLKKAALADAASAALAGKWLPADLLRTARAGEAIADEIKAEHDLDHSDEAEAEFHDAAE